MVDTSCGNEESNCDESIVFEPPPTELKSGCRVVNKGLSASAFKLGVEPDVKP